MATNERGYVRRIRGRLAKAPLCAGGCGRRLLEPSAAPDLDDALLETCPAEMAGADFVYRRTPAGPVCFRCAYGMRKPSQREAGGRRLM